jgi:putative NADPH-quinone reductase
MGDGKFPKRLLKGKTSRIIMTMGMPGLIYKVFYCAHSYKALKGMLKFCGIKVSAHNFFGMIEGSEKRRKKMLEKVYGFGICGK